eukprot:5230487-Karenia_brevis.AAC.1
MEHLSAFYDATKIYGGQVGVKWTEREISTGSSGHGHGQALLPRTAHNYPTNQSLFPEGKQENTRG